MPTNDIFGPIFTEGQLEQDVIALLQEWFPDYLRDMEYKLGLTPNSVDNPKQYTTRNTFDSLPGEESPRIVVICGPMSNPPRKNGYGMYSAMFRLGIGVGVATSDVEFANHLVSIYAAAATAIMTHKCNTGRVDWIGRQPVDLPLRDQILQYRAYVCEFSIEVDNVLNNRGGPDVPTTPPGTVYGEVEHVYVQTDLESLGE